MKQIIMFCAAYLRLENVVPVLVRIIILNISFILFLTPALAEDEPVLKEKIIVHNDIVTLGDLFLNAGIRENVAVFQSPQIGTKGVISASRVQLAAQRNGLIWSNPGNISRISVERPSRFISLKDIKDLLSPTLSNRAGIENTENMDVIFARGSQGLHLNSKNNAPLVVMSSQINPQTGAFRAVIGTEELSGVVAQATYAGRVLQTANVVVPSKIILTGSTITTGDIKTIKLPMNRVRSNHVRREKFALGKAATRQLQPNIPIFKNDVEVPKIVKKNESVDIRFNIPGLFLRTKGKAMEDGAKGEEITVINEKSKRKIQAVVTGPGAVSVSNTQRPNIITSTTGQPSQPADRFEGYLVR